MTLSLTVWRKIILTTLKLHKGTQKGKLHYRWLRKYDTVNNKFKLKAFCNLCHVYCMPKCFNSSLPSRECIS